MKGFLCVNYCEEGSLILNPDMSYRPKRLVAHFRAPLKYSFSAATSCKMQKASVQEKDKVIKRGAGMKKKVKALKCKGYFK